jgi:hypothetical protein
VAAGAGVGVAGAGVAAGTVVVVVVVVAGVGWLPAVALLVLVDSAAPPLPCWVVPRAADVRVTPICLFLAVFFDAVAVDLLELPTTNFAVVALVVRERSAATAVGLGVPHMRPLECWLSRLFITDSIREPVPFGPGG